VDLQDRLSAEELSALSISSAAVRPRVMSKLVAPRAARAEVRVSQRFRAPPGLVFDAWLDPAIAGAWLFATASRPIARVEIDARVGGSFRFADRRDRTEYIGEYVEIIPPRRLVFRLLLENSPRVVTRVTAEIVPLETGCELRLVHENVPPGQASRTEGRWTGMLYGLGETLKRRQEP
jgi:uncharacterized protein YndB with AHSA1/START domain